LSLALCLADLLAFCAQHQKSIVDDILTIFRLDSDLLTLTPATVQPLAIAKRAVKMFEAELNKKGISMVLELHSSFAEHNVDFVSMDPNRVMQILINLVTNAIKFTQSESRQKSITVTVSAYLEPPSLGIPNFEYVPTKVTPQPRTPQIEREEWGYGSSVFISFVVADTGRGLTLEEKKLLFMRFSQASPRTHAQYGGSGLGLFISRQLTELHGGEIGVASEYGVGSSFGFYTRARRAPPGEGEDIDATLEPAFRQEQPTSIMVSAAASAPLSAPPPAGDVEAKGGLQHEKPALRAVSSRVKPRDISVLVVEDNVVNRKVLQRQLERLGYSVSLASHGGQALSHIETTSRWTANAGPGRALSVVLMDLEMPVCDGLEASRRIREHERLGSMVGHVPIIAVSANVRAEQMAEARASGMDDVLSKPFRIPELVRKIEDVLGRLGDEHGWSAMCDD
jgi:CheY-like chemotaxis protein